MENKRKIVSMVLWLLAIIIIGFYVVYENDPYDPFKGEREFSDGVIISFEIIRSSVIGSDLNIAVEADENVSGFIEYRRVSSKDEWAEKKMVHGILKV